MSVVDPAEFTVTLAEVDSIIATMSAIGLGPTGPQGPPGEDGTDARQILLGDVPPDPGPGGFPSGEEGWLYLDTGLGGLYENVDTEWVQIGNLVPQGGTTGQVLGKASNTDHDLDWVDGGVGEGADEVWVGTDEPEAGFALWFDTDATAVSESMSAVTEDTEELYRVVLFSDGTCRAIPFAAVDPDLPEDFARTVRVNSVKLTWSAAAGATTYAVYRDGEEYDITADLFYRDTTVTLSETYAYAVQAISAYGLRSGITAELTAFIDPALNVTPVTEVRSWPATVALGNRAVIRVNASDADAQVLALLLETDVGSLIATADPSVWYLDPV